MGLGSGGIIRPGSRIVSPVPNSRKASTTSLKTLIAKSGEQQNQWFTQGSKRRSNITCRRIVSPALNSRNMLISLQNLTRQIRRVKLGTVAVETCSPNPASNPEPPYALRRRLT